MNLDSAIFYTANILNAVRFYEDVLGFNLNSQSGDYYASFLFPNSARLGIKKADNEREVPGAQTIVLSIGRGIEEFYQQLQKKNIPIYKTLTTQEWGKNFAILDPDKNKVEFVERLLETQ